jgi:hypothetical protein
MAWITGVFAKLNRLIHFIFTAQYDKTGILFMHIPARHKISVTTRAHRETRPFKKLPNTATSKINMSRSYLEKSNADSINTKTGISFVANRVVLI